SRDCRCESIAGGYTDTPGGGKTGIDLLRGACACTGYPCLPRVLRCVPFSPFSRRQSREVALPSILSRRAFGGAALALIAASRTGRAAAPGEIHIDWATYNPVSIVLKEHSLLEQELAADKIGVRWVQSLGSNKALEFLNAGSIDFGSTAGAAALI